MPPCHATSPVLIGCVSPTAKELYPEGDSIVKYLHHVSAKYQVLDKIQLNTDVTECVWSDTEQLWTCTLSHMAPGTGDLGAKDRFAKIARDGESSVYLRQEKVKAKIVVSCVGGLVEPKSWPDNILGAADFKGELFHAARWPGHVDLTDKNVVVIGAGCSAAQVGECLAREMRAVADAGQCRPSSRSRTGSSPSHS